MTTLRQELLTFLQKRIDTHRSSATVSAKTTEDATDALLDHIRADEAEYLVMHMHGILSRHGQ